METFFVEQQQRLRALNQEDVLTVDIVCQLLDAVHPEVHCRITKKDLRRTQLAPLFFDCLCNLNKFMASETRDALRIKQIHATPQLTEWDRYAIAGYYQLAEPEGDEGDYEGDYSGEDEGDDGEDGGMDDEHGVEF